MLLWPLYVLASPSFVDFSTSKGRFQKHRLCSCHHLQLLSPWLFWSKDITGIGQISLNALLPDKDGETSLQCSANCTGYQSADECSSKLPVLFTRHCWQAPKYRADDIHLFSEGHDGMFNVPCTHNTFSDRSFAAAETRLWNCLPSAPQAMTLATENLNTCWKDFIYFFCVLNALEIVCKRPPHHCIVYSELFGDPLVTTFKSRKWFRCVLPSAWQLETATFCHILLLFDFSAIYIFSLSKYMLLLL